MLVPEAIRFNSTPLLATWSPETIISSRAHILRANTDLERSLCTWLNSTFGIIWLRIIFTTLEEKFGHIYGWHLRILRIPDFRNASISKRFNKIFDKYFQFNWAPLPEQYERVINGTDFRRLEYDLDVIRAISETSGLDFDEKETKIVLMAIYSELLGML